MTVNGDIISTYNTPAIYTQQPVIVNNGNVICGASNFMPVYGTSQISFNPGPSNYCQIGTSPGQKFAYSQNLPAPKYVSVGVNTGMGTPGTNPGGGGIPATRLASGV